INFVSDKKSLWSGACRNCQKNYNVHPNTTMRCRLTITVHETGNKNALIYGFDAEKIISLNGIQLYEAVHNKVIDLRLPQPFILQTHSRNTMLLVSSSTINQITRLS
ncbi:tonoplast monosaccharide transporter2, partial [Striga asiatica]